MLVWKAIRSTSLAAVGLLVLLSFAAPDDALAAPNPSATPAPQRAPRVVSSPSTAPASTATPSPSPTSSPTASPTPSVIVKITVTPTPRRVSISTPQPRQSTPQRAGTPDDQAAAEVQQELEVEFDWHAFIPTDMADHLATMERAARESDCGVPWQLLAAIARVESDFGRNMATSSAGAVGYGQFLPESWRAFGSEGNAYDYRDALPAIATYLCHSGVERDPRAALFAYNHADWYVDLVLGLAVRYDRMTSGAPVPDVLDAAPTQLAGKPLHYAAGRDLRLQARTRGFEGDVNWLGVPWYGRAIGQAVSRKVINVTTLNMLRAAFGLRDVALAGGVGDSGDVLDGLASLAWDNGLLPVRSFTPCTVEDVRHELAGRRPVVAKLGDDQVVVIIGTTSNGLIYSDPSFSSTLGYGLELDNGEFEKGCRRALSFALRPKAREAHVREAEAPEPLARERPTPTPRPLPTFAPTAEILAEPQPEPDPEPAAESVAAAQTDADYSWAVFSLSAVPLGALAVLRRRRARSSASSSDPEA